MGCPWAANMWPAQITWQSCNNPHFLLKWFPLHLTKFWSTPSTLNGPFSNAFLLWSRPGSYWGGRACEYLAAILTPIYPNGYIGLLCSWSSIKDFRCHSRGWRCRIDHDCWWILWCPLQNKLYIFLENSKIIILPDGISQQRITWLCPIHAFCTFIWNPQHEYMQTCSVSAVQALTFEDEYLGYEHLSLSLGHHQAYVCCSVSKASPQRVLAQIGSLSGRSFGCIFYLFQYAGTGQGWGISHSILLTTYEYWCWILG